MKKFVYSTMAFSLVAAMAVAVPPGPGGKSTMETPGMTTTGTEPYLNASANFTNIISTGFEAPDWQAGYSVCGDQFGFGVTCFYPVTNVCLFKNHAANQNCCPADEHNPAAGDPNPDTGWSMSPSSRQCNYPGITTANPFAGTQHLRFDYDPLGGRSGSGCVFTGAGPGGYSGFGSACRTRAITAQVRQPDVSHAVWSMEVNWSGLSSSMIQVVGQDTSVGSVFFTGYIYWYYLGYLLVYDFYNGGFIFAGYFSNYLDQYVNFTADYNPCEDKITYSYAGQLIAVVPFGFTPPFGDVGDDILAPIPDTTFYTQDHWPGSRTDIDDHIVTFTPCSDACCDGNAGTCSDGADAQSCSGAGMHYYPNVLCSQLGTADKYPPVCGRDTGACCDHGPGAGGPGPEGACTDGVLAEGCAGAQQTFTLGATCAGAAGACNVGAGQCDATGFCRYGVGKIGSPCASDADCDVAGFCSAGKVGDLCTTDADCDVPSITCVEDTGSCCNTLEGTCTDGQLAADCSGAQRVWTKLGECASVECSAVLGACCDTDPFGGCTDTTQAGCTCATCTWTKLGTCFGNNAVACTHTAIPTISEWGLVVLTLLLLTGAKVYFGRREAVA